MLLYDYVCPYCGAPAEICDSVKVYPNRKSYGRMLVCTRFPECDAYVGCHSRSNLPKGTMANAELRSLRKEAHDLFDVGWKNSHITRSKAYAWLAEQLGLRKEEAHIGLFDPATCRKVIALCRSLKVA